MAHSPLAADQLVDELRELVLEADVEEERFKRRWAKLGDVMAKQQAKLGAGGLG